jgi:hypothetical protein
VGIPYLMLKAREAMWLAWLNDEGTREACATAYRKKWNGQSEVLREAGVSGEGGQVDLAGVSENLSAVPWRRGRYAQQHVLELEIGGKRSTASGRVTEGLRSRNLK